MNNNNFNASELPQVYEAIFQMHNGFDALDRACHGSYSDHVEIADMVRSEDSFLADTWAKSCELSAEFEHTSSKILNQISNEFEKYVKDTLGNEYDATRAVANINQQLESDRQALAEIEI